MRVFQPINFAIAGMYADFALKRKIGHGADEDIEFPVPSDCGTMNKTNFDQLEVSNHISMIFNLI